MSVCLYFPRFLTEIQSFEICNHSILSWSFKRIKLFSRLPLFPCKLFLRYFLSIFVYCYFFMFLYFLGTIQLLYNIFLKMFLVLPTFYLIKFCTNVFCITLTVNEPRKFSLHIALCLGGYMQYFWDYFGYISWELLSLEKLKRFPWFFHECLDIIVVVTKLNVISTFPQPLTFFGVFDPFCTTFLK